MKLTIAIPVFNQIEETKGEWGCLVANTVNRDNVELLVINNGSTDGTKEFLEKFVFPYFPDHRIIDHEENIGMLASMQEAYKESKGDVIAILHNDVYVLDYGWNDDVMQQFELDPKLGLAGFLGAKGIGKTGGRMFTMSNMLEAEYHGERVQGVKDAIVFDGLSLICRREMLDSVGGFDQNYTYHHFYDRDISCASYFAGWHNKVIGIYCHHRSGITANRSDYGKWIAEKMKTKEGDGDLASYKQSEAYFIQKWGDKLPVCLSA
jgi:glycosyltransferase involved in cell wall biosynthesis